MNHLDDSGILYTDDMKVVEPDITPKRFCDFRYNIEKCVRLNADYEHHPTPEGFNTELLPHQQTVLAAMLNVEEIRMVQGRDKINPHGSNTLTFETCAGLLSEKFGSGKTIIILALIMAKPVPDNKPIYQVCRYNTLNESKRSAGSSFFIKKSFRQDNILKPALLFVASSVVMQWRKAIKEFTHFKVLSISSVYDLRILYTRMKNMTINDFDIILVKNGNITGDFNIEGYVEEKNKKNQRKIYNIIANISRKYCWSRVILDDYDIIKLPRPTSLMNGLFTWFISATEFRVTTRVNENVEHEHINDILTYHNIDLHSMSQTSNMSCIFNVCNEPEFTEDSITVGKPVFWIHPVEDINKIYIQMIGTMAGDKADEIMEALNGDAIETAASRAGIKSDNITDIFKKILQDQYDKYFLSVNTLTWIETLDIEGFKYLDDPIDDDVYHQKNIYEQKPIEYKYPDIRNKVLNVQEACILSKSESGKSIDRVKDNIKEGDCPVCCNDLKDSDAIIVRCCGKILCADCGMKGTNIKRRANSITGKCPNCRSIITLNDIIFLEEGFNLEHIITEKKEDEEEKIIPHNINDIIDKKKDTCKFEILRRIIKCENLPNKKETDITIIGMLKGIKNLPEAPPEHRKVIIFSKFDESLDKLEKKMTDSNIKYKRLRGTVTQIHAIATEFQDSYDGVNVLLINGEKYASGLNLQSATDLVFMHKISDRAIESQIIGRIQRMGRIYKAHIHYILYEHEIEPYN
jgi:SNF2 family DNA or RNA helicase